VESASLTAKKSQNATKQQIYDVAAQPKGSPSKAPQFVISEYKEKIKAVARRSDQIRSGI